MAAGTTGSTSTYSGGSGLSFTKDIASRVVDAAVAAKEEKKQSVALNIDRINTSSRYVLIPYGTSSLVRINQGWLFKISTLGINIHRYII